MSVDNKKILALANTIATAIEAEAEEILADAEAVVREFVPAKYVKATLETIEKSLEDEGVEALFDKRISREALRKTASEEISETEIAEVAKAIAEAIVDEIEDVLNDTDEVADEEVDACDGSEKFEYEAKLKNLLERKMAAKGIYFRLARNQKAVEKTAEPVKKSLLDKIKSSK